MKRVRLGLIVFILISGFGLVNAQKKCGTMDMLNVMLLRDTSLSQRMQEMETRISQAVQYGDSTLEVVAMDSLELDSTSFVNNAPPAEPVYYKLRTIPVVFHIIHDPKDKEGQGTNISKERIMSQLKRLTEDFRKLNEDRIMRVPKPFKSLMYSAEIEFVLAKQDPKGKATNGINRIPAEKKVYTPDDVHNGPMPKTIWNRDSYLNIWVCNLVDSGGTDLFGYSYFKADSDSEHDGVVIRHDLISTTSAKDSMRTLTHEVGHYFSLLHIWGDKLDCTDDDNVEDTPYQGGPTKYKSTPVFPLYDECQTKENKTDGVMFCNYMDYSADKYLTMFTKGQVARMRYCLKEYRSDLLKSKGAQMPDVKTNTDLDSSVFVNTVLPGNVDSASGDRATSVDTSNHDTDSTANMRLVLSAGTENVDLKSASVFLYPNPSTGRFIISSDEITGAGINFRICNLIGGEVLKGIITSTPYNIDISSQPNGIYFINIVPITIGAGRKNFNEKIVIQK